jgi:outer membrane translocation and assembly module TamA
MFRTTTRITWIAVPLFALSVGTLGGCNLFDRDKDNDRDDRSSSTLGRPSDLPRSADRVEQGTGNIDYRVTRDGTAYVVDENSGATVLRVKVSSGDRIEVKPDKDDITLNGKDLLDGNLAKDHRHGIYIAPR